MLKQSLQVFSLIFADLLAIIASGYFAICIGLLYSNSIYFDKFLNLGLSKILILIILARFLLEGQYVKRTPFWQETLFVVKDIFFFLLINLALSFIFRKTSPKSVIIVFWLLLVILIPIFRHLIRLLLLKLHIYQRKLILLIDKGSNVDKIVDVINNMRFGYEVSGVCVLDGKIPEDLSSFIIYQEKGLKNLSDSHQIEVIASLSEIHLNNKESLLSYISQHFLALRIIPQIKGIPLVNLKIETFYATDRVMIYLENNLAKLSNRFAKRLFDIICSGLLIILLSPVFIIVGLLIMLQTGSAPFFFHKRVGKYGKYFNCMKFQTMLPNNQKILENYLSDNPDAELEWNETFKLKNDPRVTKIGGFLRKASLDELPQVFNVLLGQMSLVGPRPIVEKEIAKYDERIYYYYLVRPGITGLWQVSGRSDTDYDKRVYLDEYYVKSWSLWSDIVILMRTFVVVLKRDGAY